MALQLKFNVCQAANCKSITFTELTEAYNASTNTTGWGAPNTAIGAATAATLGVTFPDGTSLADPINLFSDYPTVDPTAELVITSEDLGYGGTSLPDGLYVFTYTVTTDGATHVAQITKLFYCQAKCCVHKKLAQIPDADCGCDDDKIWDALLSYTFLQGLIDAAKCGSTTRFTKILKIINKLCNTSDCGCK